MLKIIYVFSMLAIIIAPLTTKAEDQQPIEQKNIIGADTDNNGIWDYIDDYIDSKYPDTSNKRSALQQTTTALQQYLIDAEYPDKTRNNSEALGRGVDCLFEVTYVDKESFSTGEAGLTIDELEALVINTKERSDAYLKATNQLAGTTPKSSSKTPCDFILQTK